MFNWEELGKISPDLLRTMRYITFGEYRPSYDGAFFWEKRRKSLWRLTRGLLFLN